MCQYKEADKDESYKKGHLPLDNYGHQHQTGQVREVDRIVTEHRPWLKLTTRQHGGVGHLTPKLWTVNNIISLWISFNVQ